MKYHIMLRNSTTFPDTLSAGMIKLPTVSRKVHLCSICLVTSSMHPKATDFELFHNTNVLLFNVFELETK